MPLRVLFVDMRGFFASVEQQLRPELRHRPVAVTALQDVESTCVIASSIEAKRYGVKTGTPVPLARRLCPGLAILGARPTVYVQFHHRIRQAVERCLPVETVESIDEMHGRLIGEERRPDRAMRIGARVRATIRSDVGRHLLCGVGIAPNRLLAKIASNLAKVKGINLIDDTDLPHALYGLGLTDLPGINVRMEARLRGQGVHTVRSLCEADVGRLRAAWGGIVGDRWWHWLRGEELTLPQTRRRSVGHSHVLPPPYRNESGAWSVVVRLTHKVAARLLSEGLFAGRLHLYLSFGWREQGWGVEVPLGDYASTLTMLRALDDLWAHRPRGTPTQVAVTCYDLTPRRTAQLPLMPRDRLGTALDEVMATVDARYGRHTLHFGSLTGATTAAPMRISFGHIPSAAVEGCSREPI